MIIGMYWEVDKKSKRTLEEEITEGVLCLESRYKRPSDSCGIHPKTLGDSKITQVRVKGKMGSYLINVVPIRSIPVGILWIGTEKDTEESYKNHTLPEST